LKAGVAQAVAEAYVEHAKGKKAIVFTVSVDQAKRTAAALQAEGVAAEWISGALPTEERRAILKRLKTGETQVVVNCMVLTEGFDEPTVECVVVARPTKSRSLYIQMIGRGTRKAPGKDHCLILDVTGVSKRQDRKSTRLNSSHVKNLVCRLLLEKKKKENNIQENQSIR